MSLSSRTRAEMAVSQGILHRKSPDQIIDMLFDDGLLMPEPDGPEESHTDAPTIIRTVEELEALDGPVWVTCRDSIPLAAGQLIRAIREYGSRHYLPAVVVTPAAQVRAARKALEEA